jgi:pyridoxamine 5'-phosphate oxidase-like protein
MTNEKAPAVPRQGSVALLGDPVAQALLRSTVPARLSYVWRDGTPRCVPIWFHWNGKELVLGSPASSPKVRALSPRAKVALTIDDDRWPYKVLQIRGTARVETVAGVVPEYALAAERYFGPEQGRAWIEQVRAMFSHMARIVVTPEWVAVLDFETRFPGAIAAAMSAR